MIRRKLEGDVEAENVDWWDFAVKAEQTSGGEVYSARGRDY